MALSLPEKVQNLEKGKGDEGEVQSTTPLFGMTAKLQLQGGLQALERSYLRIRKRLVAVGNSVDRTRAAGRV